MDSPLSACEREKKRLEEALRARYKLISELDASARADNARRREVEERLRKTRHELKDAKAESIKLSRLLETTNEKIGGLNEEITKLRARHKEGSTQSQLQLQQAFEESQRKLKHARATISGLTQSAKKLKAQLERCRREKEEMGLIYKRTLPECEKASEYLEGLARCIRSCQQLASPISPESHE